MAISLVNREGRAGLLRDGRVIDLESRSEGRFSSDPMEAVLRWKEVQDWGAGVSVEERDEGLDPARLGPCVPRPRSVFAIGLNYRDHAAEAGLDVPSSPMVFTKFPSCLAGPLAEVPLTSDKVDWEVELVAVIGRRCSGVGESEAEEVVSGFCVGQDISDRELQFSDRPPQFSLGKSAHSYGPIGPALVSREDVPGYADLEISCEIDGEVMQHSRTSNLIFGVTELVAYLARYVTLEPGDLIFTGTPGGVGSVRTPRRYLQEGEVIRSEIAGLGELRNLCVAG